MTIGVFYRLTDAGRQCLSLDDEACIVLQDELYGDRVTGFSNVINIQADTHWLADEYVAGGKLERVETSGFYEATLTFQVTEAHDGLFAVCSGESVLAVVARYGIARSIACYAVSPSGGYSDVVVCAATPWSAITHNDVIDFI